MILLRLELANFLSYRQKVEIDFFNIHLACISGANGSGKSSILDAITWSLFGRSRSKSEDDIVNWAASLRGDKAEVTLTFELEGVIYRAIRQRIANKRGMLEFQIATNDGQWKTLSSGGIRKTQSTIEETLRMNYDTFINASFLLQGKADEFTTKTANKRKEILADLLGVNEWDIHKESVSKWRKEEENQLAIIDLRLDDIEKELAERPQREANLATAASALENVTVRLKDNEALLEQTRINVAAVKQQEQTVNNLQNNLSQRQGQLEELQSSLERRRVERSEYQLLIDETDVIQAKYKQWQKAETATKKWQILADQNHDLVQQMNPYKIEIASERSRLEQRKATLEKQQKQVGLLKAEQPQLQGRLQVAVDKLTNLSEQLDKSVQDEEKIQTAKAELQSLLAERNLLAQEASQLGLQEKRIVHLKAEQQKVSLNKAAAEEALETISNSLEKQEKAAQALMKASAERDNLKGDFPGLKEKMLQMKQRIDQLEVESGRTCPLCGQALSEEHRKLVLMELKAEGQQLGDRYRNSQEKISSLEKQIGELDKKYDNETQLDRERRNHQGRLANANSRLEEMERQFIAWREGPEERFSELQALLGDESALKEKQRTLEIIEQKTSLRVELEEQRLSVQSQVSRLQTRQVENARILDEWEGRDSSTGMIAELALVNEQLDNDNFAGEQREALAALREQIKILAYDIQAHKAASKLREELSTAVDRYQLLQQAKAAIKPLDDSLSESKQQISNGRKELAELDDQYQSALQQLINLKEGSLNQEEVEDQVFRLREEKIKAHTRVAISQQGLDVLAGLGEEQKSIRNDRDALTQRIRRLKLLEKACGREGVQALLIERALPEIEGEANELLGRLSEGQMHIEFLTQRKLKSSDRLAETLDIRISDSDGERPYENYSGGEQFRINFAIRLALSQILAKRAGARLQTLVIDEGFGSQDPEGRRRLINAIQTIQDDFERILIITHIDEMRDAFPSRIEVNKGLEGSTVTVM